MSENYFWEPQVQQLIKEVDLYLDKNPSGRKVTAFDADGTCWFNDVGRDFYLYQCENIFKNVWKWEDYASREKIDVGESLWWLAEINHQASTHDLLLQAQGALEAYAPLRLIPSQKTLIDHLHKKGVEVYVVTASVKWSVVPAAAELGIDTDHVLGVTTLVDDQDRLTLSRFEPITWREGKPQALLNATQGTVPFLCSGNTISDKPLIEAASHFKVSVNSADENDPVFNSEKELKKIAEEQSWWHFDYLGRP